MLSGVRIRARRTVTGEIRLNGRTASIAEFKPLRGFVPQDDIVHAHLTVRCSPEMMVQMHSREFCSVALCICFRVLYFFEEVEVLLKHGGNKGFPNRCEAKSFRTTERNREQQKE